ncbi:MAG TPA: glucosamine-6-phosphate deaminase [Tepidisphaeraceae bacterium]|nr:glucosamine-6-phosphate deaminase [Tepidisphaeraceae bacterium]
MTSAHRSPQHSKLPHRVFKSAHDASRSVAAEIAALIRETNASGRPCVLGLATGSTPTGVYGELIRMHVEEGLSFRNVITFNLDEYYPMQPGAVQSYVRFMHEHLFDHIDVPPAYINLPDGTLAIEKVPAFCDAYEAKIEAAGGIDLQILGIGRSGHIGFNEPGSSDDSRTRIITLDKLTRLDAAGDFFGEQYVPRRAITMGVGTILRARRVIMLAFGEGKAGVIAKAMEGPVTPAVSASFLQRHPNTLVVLDDASSAKLACYAQPWTCGPVKWDDPELVKKAVIALALETRKPILHLTEEDYNEGGLQDLLAQKGRAYDTNLNVFRALTATVTGWPGGKPDHAKRPGDISRPGDDIFPKRCLIFSPHPDDDVISMGGTLIRLVDHGHDVHVAYQTSGNIAVFDADALRFADFARDFAHLIGVGTAQTDAIEQHIEEFLRNKQPGQLDSKEIAAIKGLIRRGEARAGCRECGVPMANLHFLDMPFYETGAVKKKPIGEPDVQLIVDLLEQLKPHQIYAAGDLSDPHGTHRVCLDAIVRAIARIKHQPWFGDCQVWLYRGAWQEWEPERVDMAVPLSPEEVERKRLAIFRHQSQKDRAMFPGADPREFWQRAEDRNRETAVLYDRLGLAQYAAMEGFVRWTGAK